MEMAFGSLELDRKGKRMHRLLYYIVIYCSIFSYFFSCVFLTLLSVIVCRYLDSIEMALSAGEVVLIENLGETVDPVLGPLLGQETIKKGR